MCDALGDSTKTSCAPLHNLTCTTCALRNLRRLCSSRRTGTRTYQSPLHTCEYEVCLACSNHTLPTGESSHAAARIALLRSDSILNRKLRARCVAHS